MKKVLVLSLGGSVILPEKNNSKFLENFKKILQRNYKTHKFVLVTGGGTLARKYISTLKKQKLTNRDLARAGIMATRTNARFIMQFFGKKESNDLLPTTMKKVKDNLRKNNVVICGALRYEPNSTSDSTAAQIANYLKTEFVNITNVPGLYTANPKKHKNAKFIAEISWKEFEKMAKKSKFQPGQHFVLDQNASEMIRQNKTKTYIMGEDLKNLDKFLKGKKFTGTTISDKEL